MSFSEHQSVVKLFHNLRFPEHHGYDVVFERRNPSFVGSMMKLNTAIIFCGLCFRDYRFNLIERHHNLLKRHHMIYGMGMNPHSLS